MTTRFLSMLAGLGARAAVSASAQAQNPPLNFDQAAYITCREAHAMSAIG